MNEEMSSDLSASQAQNEELNSTITRNGSYDVRCQCYDIIND